MTITSQKENIENTISQIKSKAMDIMQCGKLVNIISVLTHSINYHKSFEEYNNAIKDMVSLFDVSEEEAKTNNVAIRNKLINIYVSKLHDYLTVVKNSIPTLKKINQETKNILDENISKSNIVSIESVDESSIDFYNRGYIKDIITTFNNNFDIYTSIMQALSGCIVGSESSVAFEEFNINFETLESSVSAFKFKTIKLDTEKNTMVNLQWRSVNDLLLLKDDIFAIDTIFDKLDDKLTPTDIFNISKSVEDVCLREYKEDVTHPNQYMNMVVLMISSLVETTLTIPLNYVKVLSK